MIYIEENFVNNNAVSIRVDGVIDDESLLTLNRVIQTNMRKKMRVTLNLKGLMHINHGGKAYLKKYCDSVKFEGLSEYLKMELDLRDL